MGKYLVWGDKFKLHHQKLSEFKNCSSIVVQNINQTQKQLIDCATQCVVSFGSPFGLFGGYHSGGCRVLTFFFGVGLGFGLHL